MVVPANALPLGADHLHRFPRRNRLKSPDTIRSVMRDSRSSRRGWDSFRLVWSSSEKNEHGDPRFAFVVSRDAGSAVTRNLLKRRLRECVRLNRDAWPKSPDLVILRVNSDNAASMPFDILLTHVREAIQMVRATERNAKR